MNLNTQHTHPAPPRAAPHAFTRRQDGAPQRPPEQRSLSREELRELVAEMLG